MDLRGAALIGLALPLFGAAPVQCGEPEPIQYARQDDPAETVYRLGERLRSHGHAEAARDAFRFLIERYPSSRWAERARAELEPEPQPAAPAPSTSTSRAAP